MAQKIFDLIKKFTPLDWILLAGLFFGLITVGIFVAKSVLQKPRDVEFIAGNKAGENGGEMFVDVAGAVALPGVYQLPVGARIKDALVAAGGMSDLADREYVARMVNLAEVAKDGQKVFIPERKTGSGINTDQAMVVNPGLVNINTAGVEELDTLWGVGETRAQAIIVNRPYKSVEELVDKKVLPSNILEKNRDKLTIY